MERGDLWKPFEQYVNIEHNEFWDTGAQLYAGIKDRVWSFSDEQLGAYDHLFGGSTPEYQGKLLGHRGLERGLWRVQDRHFKRRAVADPA